MGYRSKRWAGFVAMFLALSTGPGLVAGEAPLVDLALGTAYESNFNDSGGGFEVSKVVLDTHDWQWGEPTSGPGVANSGTKVWATNLGGDYRNNHCGAILSPTIDLSNATTASVSFMQWRHLERGTPTGTIWDAGRLFATTDGGATYVSIDDPVPAYDSGTLSSAAATCLQGIPTGSGAYAGPSGTDLPPPVYSQVEVDLSGFAGETVRFAIAMGSDSSVTRTGWYIDDFAVTVDGSTTVQDFEGGPAGFTTVNWGPAASDPTWEHGVPTTGPSGVDGSAWGTNLDGNYAADECGALTSPAIDLTNPLATKATLSWRQWFRTNSSGAGGVVQVSTDGETWTNLVPVGGYPGSANPTGVDACLGNVATGSRGFFGAIQAVGEPMVDQQVDLTPFVGNVVQVRFLFASTSSTLRSEGWYVDDLDVALSLWVAQPSLPLLGGNDAPLWTSGGDNSSWDYGASSAPGPAGDTVYGTNLGDGSGGPSSANHNADECSYVESPAVPGALLSLNPTLSFEHWYRIESTFATGSAWDGGVVVASGDGGQTWTYLDLDEYTRPAHSAALKSCLAAYGLPATTSVFSGEKTSFDAVTYDLSELAGSPSVQVRFVFGSDNIVQYQGWYLKNVSLGGVQLLP